jgi:hypothetical protein
MNRIQFIKQLFAGSALLLLPKTKIEKPVREIRLSSPDLAGFQYYQGPEIEPQLRQNNLLTLRREPTNPHDCYAIEVFQNNAKLGYLPRAENKVIARLMDQGVAVKARILKVDPEVYAYPKVKIKVFYETIK